jgi:hypothetical protein
MQKSNFARADASLPNNAKGHEYFRQIWPENNYSPCRLPLPLFVNGQEKEHIWPC